MNFVCTLFLLVSDIISRPVYIVELRSEHFNQSVAIIVPEAPAAQGSRDHGIYKQRMRL